MVKLKLGVDDLSQNFWNTHNFSYIEALEKPYHEHRLNVINSIIPKSLYCPSCTVIDFGCGNGIHLIPLLRAGCKCIGIDTDSQMCKSASDLVSASGLSQNCKIIHDDISCMRSFNDASITAILSFNVLAYLSDEEEMAFYEESSRLIHAGGFLSVTHSNELFDLFTFNSSTRQFFDSNFECDISSLLSHPSKGPDVTYSVRENPLSYKHKLAKFGFAEFQQVFINSHSAPPLLTNTFGGGGGSQIVQGHEKNYPSTLDAQPEEAWKLIFKCSTFGSLSSKNS